MLLPSTMRKGTVLCNAMYAGDLMVPLATILAVMKDDGHHSFRQTPIPLL
jgi:hypothetical protein